MLFSIIYDIALFLTLLFAPFRWLGNPFSPLFNRKRAKQRLLGDARRLPKRISDRIWVHGVSVGEIKAVAPLLKQWKEKDPDRQFVITTITETGMQEAMRHIAFADLFFYFPIDFRLTMSSLVQNLAPTHVLLSETDFWFHFLDAAKKQGAKIALVNGKISETSTNRLKKIFWFAQKIFSPIDRFCVQDAIYAERFFACGVPHEKLTITSNLKFVKEVSSLSQEERAKQKQKWNISAKKRIVTIGSTHPTEEELLFPTIEALLRQVPSVHLFLVPRHPHRAKEVADLLRKKNISFSLSSKYRGTKSCCAVTLVDEMGVLPSLFPISDVSILGGSFVPGIGGHNLFEPCCCGSPVLFGPYMEEQREMVHHVLAKTAGKQVGVKELSQTLLSWLTREDERNIFSQNGLVLAKELQGALEKTDLALRNFFS